MNSMYPMKSRTQAPRPKATPKKAGSKTSRVESPSAGRRIQVRRSGVHGKGVYALQPIAAGDTLIEYVGEIISWPEALRRHPHDPKDPNHTFYFSLDDGREIGRAHV